MVSFFRRSHAHPSNDSSPTVIGLIGDPVCAEHAAYCCRSAGITLHDGLADPDLPARWLRASAVLMDPAAHTVCERLQLPPHPGVIHVQGAHHHGAAFTDGIAESDSFILPTDNLPLIEQLVATVAAHSSHQVHASHSSATYRSPRQMVFIAASASPGATTLALSCATVCAQAGESKDGPAFVDLDVTGGGADLLLECEAECTATVLDFTGGRPAGLDALARSRNGIRVLPLPPPLSGSVPTLAELQQVVTTVLQQCLTQQVDCLVDMPAVWVDQLLPSGHQLQVVVVAHPTVTGVASLARCCTRVRAAGYDPMVVIAQRRARGVPREHAADLTTIAQLIGSPVHYELPWDEYTSRHQIAGSFQLATASPLRTLAAHLCSAATPGAEAA